jgi:hypothetical protein
MRTLLAAAMLSVLALTSGCFSGDVNVVINDDGSADLKTTLVSVPMLAEVVEQSKTTALAKNPEAQVEPVTKDNMAGYEITEHYASIEKLAENDFFKANEGKNAGITVNKSLFYSDYKFDLLFEGSQNGGGAGAFASNITFTYQMTLPVVPESSNADRTENNGKTLTWNLGKTLVTGESSKIEAAFRIWNKTAIIATVVVVLVLIGGAVFFFLRRKKPEEQQAIEAPPIDITPNDKN